ncbi:MAG TPA: LPS assembly lipoprotein LptE [Terracidiphilus sp.]|jgi:outer membrane lipopolysaccharide assembly protein LptE/RlpB|nr:LPS assembly lipoprotein LptE [Terracidiphilus sp.]
MRTSLHAACAALLLCLTACGYHTLGAATHLPANVRTLSVPLFQTHTEAYHTETLMTQAVIREFASRTRLRVTPSTGGDPDATLQGAILRQQVLPLTFNAGTQQSSSYVITVVASVTLTARDGRVLYQNKNYVFRQQFQATTNLATFLDESPAAEERLSRDFASALVADVLESL